MTFAIANFAPVGNTSKPVSGVGTTTIKGAPSIHSYVTADAVNTVSASGYFNAGVAYGGVYNSLAVGDMIYAACGAGSGGTLAPRLFVVVSKASGTVDVADGTAVTVTDTY